MAALFCASLSRSAMRRRSLVIRTRSSRAPGGRGAAGAGAGFVDGAAAGAGRSRAVSTSPLVRRPSLPEAASLAGSSPLSSTSLRTAGPERSSRSVPPPAAAAAGDLAAAGTAAAVACGLPAGAGFAAPSPIRPSSAPTATLPPSGTAISESVPAAGALTSSVTLSVSSSTSGSSMATLSPTCFSQRATVASVTDSPSAGTLISVAIVVPACRPGSVR